MRPLRVLSGITILSGSALISAVLSWMFNFDTIAGISLTSVVAFAGGCWFMSGVVKR